MSSCSKRSEEKNVASSISEGIWSVDKRLTRCFYPVERYKIVCVASTVHSGNFHSRVKGQFHASTDVVEVIVCIPDATYEYNNKMGGVDPSDQLLRYF